MKTTKGFTIIELIIVISIIALLSVIGISTYGAVQVDARNTKRKSDLKEIRAALELYRTEVGTYPSTVGRTSAGCRTSALVGDGDWCGMCSTYNTSDVFNDIDSDADSDDAGTDADDTGFIPDLAPGFMQRLPRDPRNDMNNTSSTNATCRTVGGQNCYLYNSNGVDYKLISHCSPEGTMQPDDAFFDPCRPQHAWQISSSNVVRGTLNVAGTGCETGGW